MTEEVPTTPPSGESERDSRGRFARGNAGGPGNPLGKQATAMRKAAMSALGPEVIAGIMRKFASMALQGDVAAGRLVLERVLGRPVDEPRSTSELEDEARYREISEQMRQQRPAPPPGPEEPDAPAS